MLVYRLLWILYALGVLSLSGRLMHSGRVRRLYGIPLKVYRKFPASEYRFFEISDRQCCYARKTVCICSGNRCSLRGKPAIGITPAHRPNGHNSTT